MRTSLDLNRIAAGIDALGIAANEAEIAEVVDRARAAGISPVLTAVLSDAREPEVARMRAFGLVAMRLAAAGRVPAAAGDTPAARPVLTVV